MNQGTLMLTIFDLHLTHKLTHNDEIYYMLNIYYLVLIHFVFRLFDFIGCSVSNTGFLLLLFFFLFSYFLIFNLRLLLLCYFHFRFFLYWGHLGWHLFLRLNEGLDPEEDVLHGGHTLLVVSTHRHHL